MSGYEVIIPMLRQLEPCLLDPEVNEIMVNPDGKVWVEAKGELQQIEATIPEKQLAMAIKLIARMVKGDISEEQPWVDARLPDGSRVAGVWSPISHPGSTLAIRKFQMSRYSCEDLVRCGSIDYELMGILRSAIANRRNILISGGTSTGKTTMLNALAALFDPEDRVVVIEDTSELQLSAKDLVRLEARREQKDVPAVTLRQLVKITLRLRPDRILLGEIRGEEAFELLQILNTGHSGTISTIHADSARQALGRLASCAMMANVGFEYPVILSQIADALHYVLHLSGSRKQRRAQELLFVSGFDGKQIETERMWSYGGGE